MVILKAEHLQSGYQGTPVLHDISFEVEEGKIVAILGSNGAGKTTTLRTLTGTVRATGGHVWYNGEEITKTPTYKMSQMGIALVPEGRHLFNQMSVRDNLLMGSYRVKDKALVQQRLEQTQKKRNSVKFITWTLLKFRQISRFRELIMMMLYTRQRKASLMQLCSLL